MYSKGTIFVVCLLGLLFIPASFVLATAVDRMWLNLEGEPGQTVEQEITLEGSESEERSGWWYTYYKETEGDDEKMDITPWVTFEPKDYTIKQGETKVFTVKVKIPKNAKPGLYGATSEEMGKEGRSAERRSYIVFKDALGGGNVYSGLLLPISVKVLPSKNPLAPTFNFVMQNILVIALIAVITVMAILLLKRRKRVKEK